MAKEAAAHPEVVEAVETLQVEVAVRGAAVAGATQNGMTPLGVDSNRPKTLLSKTIGMISSKGDHLLGI